jgi:replicative DNA helicase
MNSLGKIPPQALDLEEAVLGAILVESGAINEVAHILSPDSFYKNAHRLIYAAVMDLFTKSEPIDILTVASKLRSSGQIEIVGGAFYITELTARINSSAHIQEHARIIIEHAIKRELIGVMAEYHKLCYSEGSDSFDILDQLQAQLIKIATGARAGEAKIIKNVVASVMRNIESAMNLPDGITGIPSGFTDIDKITGGWQKNNLIIIAARPSMGKTAFVVNTILNAAIRFDIPVALFSLEMSDEQLVTRMIASELTEYNISTNQMTRGRIEDYQFRYISEQIAPIAKSKVFIDDTPGLTITQLRAKCHKLKVVHGVKMIVIDYLQLMAGSGKSKGNREQEISEISRGLKLIAKELQIPVIALSQLSRAVETRGGDKRPMLSDLRESGSIEQDADIVAFLYRPEYYGILEDEVGNSLKGITELIISKHRNGALDTVFLRFDSKKTKFKDISDVSTSDLL